MADEMTHDQRRLAQCGWCPELLPASDPTVWYLHFKVAHRVNGYSVRPIKGTDWDMAELTTEADRG